MEKGLFIISLLLLLQFFFPVSAIGSNVKSLYIFGDSIFDAGNNHYNKYCGAQADYVPYGSTFFHHPTGRFTNGRTVPDFLSEHIGLSFQKPFQEAYIEFMNGTQKNYPSNGINFASAGSGVLSETNQPLNVTSLEVQLQQFKSLVMQNSIDKKRVVKESIFLLESGSNDVYNYFNPLTSSTLSPEDYVQAMLQRVRSFVKQIYTLGARRIAIFSLGPVGCVPARANLPGAPTDKCFLKMNVMVRNFNLGLENIVKDIPGNYSGAVAVYAAVDALFKYFKAHPSQNGFEDVNNACCGYGTLGGQIQCGHEGYKVCANSDKYLFWDYFHPTERTYRLVSEALWTGSSVSIRPINFKTLTKVTV